jgi:hypothetical protein
MMMVMMHDECCIFDESEAPLEFDKEFDLCLDVFGHVGVCV